MTAIPTPRRLALAAGLAWCAALTGCGPPKPGDVSGTIKLHGQPPKLAGLEIVFQSADGTLTSAAIRDDGTYKADAVPPGDARVYFTSVSEESAREGLNVKAGGGRLKKPMPDKKDKAGPPKLEGTYPKTNPIRQDLREAGTSKLTVKVEAGRSTVFDYDLP